MQEFFTQYLGVILALIAPAVVLTIFVFRKRLFERGYRKGTAADPEKIKRENRPQGRSRSH